MRTVHHPVFTDVAFEVADDKAQEWKAAGWRFTPIPAVKSEGGTEEKAKPVEAPKPAPAAD